MPKVFLTYFDVLGYKEFILANSNNRVYERQLHILRDIESALAKRQVAERKPNGLVYADLSKYKINALNISDTILFWTNDLTCESFTEICECSYTFNWLMNLGNFPVRGCFLCGELNFLSWNMKNEEGGKYLGAPLYGKGIVEAHIKAEAMEWAGCVVDSTILVEISNTNCDDSILREKTLSVNVPYKPGFPLQGKELVFRFSKGQLNDVALQNWKRDITQTFQRDGKQITHEKVKLKIKNTLEFLDLHKEDV